MARLWEQKSLKILLSPYFLLLLLLSNSTVYYISIYSRPGQMRRLFSWLGWRVRRNRSSCLHRNTYTNKYNRLLYKLFIKVCLEVKSVFMFQLSIIYLSYVFFSFILLLFNFISAYIYYLFSTISFKDEDYIFYHTPKKLLCIFRND